MKNFYLMLFAMLFSFSWQSNSQILNQSAAWPNATWTVTGTYNTSASAFEASPITTANFAFDDDDAGSGSDDDIAAESPVINLTAAHAGGETNIQVSAQYGYRYAADDVLRFEYWNPTTSAWIPWGGSIPGNSTTINDNFCTIPKTTIRTPTLDISNFTPAQLSGFRYRIYYNDKIAGADYNYGFCFDSPVIKSAACVAPSELVVSNFSIAGATITWAAMTGITNYEYAVNTTAADPASGTVIAANTYTATGLSPSTTYYFHVRTVCTGANSEWRTISFTTYAAPPANDECTGAIAISINADFECGIGTNGTLNGATASDVPDNGAGLPDDDVWYSFVATATTHRITLLNVAGAPTDLVHETLSGTCAGLSSVLVSDLNTSNPTDLIIGNTYYIRVFSFASGGVPTTTFTVCVGTTPPAPANDNATGAVALTVNPDLTCTTTTNGSTFSATASTDAAPSCSATGINDDVWYTFVATSTVHRIVYTNMGTATLATAIYTGTPGTLTQLAGGCQSGASQTFGGLTPGQLYYARVYTTSATVTTQTAFTICISTPPPGPANDECTGAVSLTVNANLSCMIITAGSTLNAYQSMASTPCSGTPDDDVWFSFVATASSHLISVTNIVPVEGTSTDMYLQVLSGTCGSLTSMQCSDPESMTVTGLSAGTLYYIRVYTFSSTSRASFNICVGTFPPPPVNDDAAAAITLTVNPDLSCALTTQGTTVSATPSTQTAPSCDATGINDDVWYTFTASATTHRFVYSNVTSGTMATALYTGLPGSLVAVANACFSGAIQDFSGLTIGTLYYARVYTTTASATTNANFTVCLGTLPPAPVNDEPSGAIALTVNTDFSCAVTTSGTTISASPSTAGAPSCNATGINDDVWYTFTATATMHRFFYSNVTAGTMATALYTGMPGSLVAVANGCFSGVSQEFSGLTIGTLYYARVFTTAAAATISANFTVCVGTLPSAPANDEPSGAIALTVNVVFQNCASTINGITHSATPSSVTAPSCNTTGINDDVWFTFTASSTGVRFNYTNVNNGTIATALYSGTAASLTQITNACQSGLVADFQDLTIGTTYYVRVYTTVATAVTTTDFTLCLSALPAAPANDLCANAIPLIPGGTFAANAQIGTSTAATTTNTGLTFTCQTSRILDVWYTVVVPSSGSLTIETAAVNGSLIVDTVLSVFTGTCGALTQLDCSDDIGGGNNFSRVILTGQTPGTTIIVGVWKYSSTPGAGGEFQISAYDASLSAESFNQAKFVMYPNPVSDILNISGPQDISSVAIINMLGQQVMSVRANSNNAQVDMSSLAKGAYLVKVFSDNAVQTLRVLKQ